MVPTMLVRLLMLDAAIRGNYDISTLRHLEHNSAPCPISVKEKIIDWLGPVVFEVYGASEPSGSTFIDSRDWLAHKGSVGRAIFGQLHILDETHHELHANQVGDVFFSGSDIEFEYFNAPEKKRARSTADGWFSYGDVGYVDADGYLYLLDRKDNTIIVGGQKIYPLEVENILIGHPAVFDVAVLGRADEVYGQSVHAYVQLKDSALCAPETAAQLIQYCRSELAAFKCPTGMTFVDSLPRTENGKLLKRYLTA
jgi:acyl-CoA synthetase (AMP-forming)/AMP-acid ligase II